MNSIDMENEHSLFNYSGRAYCTCNFINPHDPPLSIEEHYKRINQHGAEHGLPKLDNA